MERLNQRKSKCLWNDFIDWRTIGFLEMQMNKLLLVRGIFFWEIWVFILDWIDEKVNDQPVGDSLDEENIVEPDRTDDEIECENLNKDPVVEPYDEEHPTARFVSFNYYPISIIILFQTTPFIGIKYRRKSQTSTSVFIFIHIYTY